MEKDKKSRLAYARKMKQIQVSNPGYWCNDVAFYLDGVSFIHKTNPMSAALSPKSDNLRAALNEIERIEAQFPKIPSKSPDLTPIESVFHLLKRSLENEAISSEISHECFDDFKARVYRALDNLSIDVIDCTIESMWDIIDAVIRSSGNRTKY